MESKAYVLRFRAVNYDIFDAIKRGRKRVETRAATKRYRDIKAGDTLVFVCGKDRFEKEVQRVQVFKTVDELVGRYKPVQINPNCRTKEELQRMFMSFSTMRKRSKKTD